MIKKHLLPNVEKSLAKLADVSCFTKLDVNSGFGQIRLNNESRLKVINRYKNQDIMRQTACLVVNPIGVDGYASLVNCTTAVRASDSMTTSS